MMQTQSKVSPISHGSESEPWEGIIKYLPKDYGLSKEGVYLDKSNRISIAGPCWVIALTRSQQSDEWGYVIHWIDHDGMHQHKAFPINRLLERSCPLASDLASMGLKIIPGKQRDLMEYLGGFSLPKDFRLQSVSKLGWLSNKDGHLVYVLPDGVISLEQTEEIIFQPEEHSPTTNTMRVHGSLERWSKYVAEPCIDNPLLIFSLCTAFSAPLLAFADLECGGFHLYGGSSKGKTTALQVGASVWGCGADPATSNLTNVNKWNSTGNALEGTAAAHNDGFLALDEMGTCDARDFGKVIYDLFGGQGKARMRKNSALRPLKTWRIMALSTGEISSRQKILDGGGKVHIGHEVRLVDIPIIDGVLVSTPGKSPGDYANSLKKNAGQYYGIAGRTFITKLIEHEPEQLLLKKYIQVQLEAWEEDLAQGKVLESFQKRVIRRFSLLNVAGILAVKFGILPFKESDITVAILSVLNRYLGDESNLPPVLRGIKKVINFVMANYESRFKNLLDSQPDYFVREIAGYLYHHQGEKVVLFTNEGIKEACNGHEYKSVLQEIRDRGFLIHEKTKLTKKFTLPGIGERETLHAIKLSLLNDELSK